ncbi:MAG TPA: hypothetical protein DHV63_01010 [Pseudomonas sp.]|nr:hypothetical protein [Pseudomonas sp.]
MYSQLTGFREYPCPEDSVSLEDAIKDQLDEHHADTMQAYTEYCGDRMEVPANLIGALIHLQGPSYCWEMQLGRIHEVLGEALKEIVYDIDQYKKAFIEHEAERRRKEAEEIKHEVAA